MINNSVRKLGVWTLGFAAVGLTSCGGGSPTEGGPPVATTQVRVDDDFFAPQNILVSAGATVFWDWIGSDFHDVAWSSAQLPDSPLQRGGMHQVEMPGATGEYAYYCTIHGTPSSGMRGTVLVQ